MRIISREVIFLKKIRHYPVVFLDGNVFWQWQTGETGSSGFDVFVLTLRAAGDAAAVLPAAKQRFGSRAVAANRRRAKRTNSNTLSVSLARSRTVRDRSCQCEFSQD